MIQIFGTDKTIVGFFKDYHELFKHINALETSKLAESNTRLPRQIWSFVLFTNKRLSYIYHKTLERSFSKVGKEAFEQELDLIEISKGDFENPLQIPVTPSVNVAQLQQNWCQDYCDAHDLLLIEYDDNFDNDPSVGTLPATNLPAINLEGRATDVYKERYARVHAPL
jgi:hypothetical protein